MDMGKKTYYGLLVVPTDARNKNIGDYIQSIAQRQFLPRVDEYVQREKISLYDNDSHTATALIMNAWYMWHPENWPPSELIIPLPISMHLSPIGSQKMLGPEGLKWFKEHEPIGCRDRETMDLLTANGVKCYFSACLTLTLHKSFNPISDDKRKGVCFVNAYCPPYSGRKQSVRLLLYALKAPYTILNMWRKHKTYFECRWNYSIPDERRKGVVPYFKSLLKSICKTTSFYKIYSKQFTNKVLRGAEYINHTVDTQKYPNDEALLDYATFLLQKYATQKYVVTSRIHAGLPCLSLGTPTIFVLHPDIVGKNSNGNRLGGLIDFFHCMRLDQNNSIDCDSIFDQQSKLDENFSFTNKTNWKEYADQMIDTCEKFVQQFDEQ